MQHKVASRWLRGGPGISWKQRVPLSPARVPRPWALSDGDAWRGCPRLGTAGVAFGSSTRSRSLGVRRDARCHSGTGAVGAPFTLS